MNRRSRVETIGYVHNNPIMYCHVYNWSGDRTVSSNHFSGLPEGTDKIYVHYVKIEALDRTFARAVALTIRKYGLERCARTEFIV